jgi:sugar/nucleoside kinase (ribokinase family)
VCADLTPELPLGVGMIPGQLYHVGPMSIRPGGCVANTGVVLARLGVQTRTSGVVGDDDLGRVVVRKLNEMGLSTQNVLTSAGTTTSYSIVLEPAGMNRSFWHHTGASETFDGSHVDLDGVDLLHVGYPPLLPGLLPNDAQPLVALLERARTAGITTSLDMAVVDRNSKVGRLDWHAILRRTLPLVDVFTPSIDDLTSALEIGPVPTANAAATLADSLISDGVAVVMLSAGEDGLLIRTASEDRLRVGGRVLQALARTWADATIWTQALPIPSIVTTNGAGDAASAALLYGMVKGYAPQETAEMAALVASQWIQNVPLRVE